MLHRDLRPDDRLVVESVTNLGRLIDAFAARDFAEFTPGQLEAFTGLSKGKLRGLLHSGWLLGWLTPVQDDPITKTIDRWALDPRFAHYAERYRRMLVQRAQELDDRFRRFQDGPASSLLREG